MFCEIAKLLFPRPLGLYIDDILNVLLISVCTSWLNINGNVSLKTSIGKESTDIRNNLVPTGHRTITGTK